MKKSLIALLLVTLLFGGCAPAPASLTPPPTATATQTKTPHPTQTAIPTATPYPPLQTDGPYLLFTHDNKNFTIMDADGSGQKQFQLPNNGYVKWWNLNKAISPNGEWLAYYIGSIEETYNLTLNLYNLRNQTSRLIAEVIAPGFPNNLEPVTETIFFTKEIDYDKECSKDSACKSRIVEIGFKEGILNFDWSPDSQNLAFAAQIDGPSSDLYIYNVEEKKKRRLTNELQNLGLITWAPNGTKILYENLIPGTVYTSRYLHIADPKIKSPQNPNSIEGGTFWSGGGWINENSYIIWSGGEGAPPHNFRSINIETQQVKEIWRYVAESFFIDRENERIFLLTFPEGFIEPQSEPEEGMYLVTFEGSYKKLTDEVFIPLNTKGPYSAYFALQINSHTDETHSLVSIEADGTITPLSRMVNFSFPPYASPDEKWLIISSDVGTELYSENLQPIKLLDINSSEMIWRPDSLGGFLSTNNEIYYLSIPDEELKLVNVCSLGLCLLQYVWLP